MPRGVPNSRPVSTENLAIRDPEVLDLTAPTFAPLVNGIESVDDEALPAQHADRLAFMEEPLVIRLEPSSERNAPRMARASVNGDTKWIPVGIPVKLRRKHVEVLARAQPFGVQTDTGTAMEANPHNRVVKTPYRRHPFTVIRDENPRGVAWLNKVTYEG